jgi:uncharacterized protein YkwD
MDPKSYPPPANMPFSPGDLQVNQAPVEGRIEATIELWNEQEIVLGKLLGINARGNKSAGGGGYAAKVAKGKLPDPCEEIVPMQQYKFVEILDGLERSVPLWQSALAKYVAIRDRLVADSKLAGMLELKLPEPPKPDPLAYALHHLFADKVEEALKKAAELDETGKTLFATLGERYLLFRSSKPDGDWNKAETGALVLLNLYRLALGLKPLLGNQHIQAAAVDHSLYQAKNGMNHGENIPEKATPDKRVHLAGYKGGGICENCASTNDPVKAIWMWRMDSGHHKNLLNTGVSTEDPNLNRL